MAQGPHLMGATLSNLLRAVHPGTIAMTDFRQRLRPKVLTRHLGDLGILHVISCSDEHIVLGIGHHGSAYPKGTNISRYRSFCTTQS